MPPQHRIARARWPLTVIGVALVAATVLSAWGRLTFTWDRGKLEVDKGSFVAELAQTEDHWAHTAHEPFGWSASWSSEKPVWAHEVIWGADFPGFDFQVSLLPISIVAITIAGWAWYRRFRPFLRLGRPDRTGTFTICRWIATTIAIAATLATTATHWRPFFAGAYDDKFYVERGYYIARISTESNSNAQSESSFFDVVDLSEWEDPYYPEFDCLYAAWYNVADDREWYVHGSLWFIVVLASTPAFFLWFLHLRRYPSLTHCTSCRYDRAGLGPSVPCPECGQVPHST